VALESGSILARLGATLDDVAFDRFDKRLKDARVEAQKDVTADLAADVEDDGFRRYENRLSDARGDADKGAEAALGADVNEAGFKRFDGLLDKLKGNASAAGSQAGSAVGENMTSKLSEFAGGGGLAGAAAAIGAALIGAVMKGVEREDLTAKLRGQLDLTAPEAAEAGATAGKLYAQAYGDSLESVNDAVRSVVQNLPEPFNVEDAAGKLLNLTTTFETEADEVTRTISTLVRTGLADNVDEAFDLITAGFQRGSDRGGEFLDTLNEYADPITDLGLSAEDFAGSITRGFDNGVYSADKLGDALKEFSIRAVDGSDTTKAAFADLGLNADDYAKRIAEGGPTARKAFGEVITALDKVKDPLKRERDGVALFGAMFEDVGMRAVDALKPVEGGLDGVNGAAKRLDDTLGNTSGATIEKFKRRLGTAFETGGAGLIKMGAAVDRGLQAVEERVGIWDESVNALMSEWARKVGDTILGFVDTFLGAVETIARVGSKLPGVGGKFKGLERAVDDAREKIDGFRRSMRGSDDDITKPARALPGLRRELDRTGDAFRRLRRNSKADLDDIGDTVAKNTARIKKRLGDDSEAGRRALSRNFREAAEAVRRQMRAGEVTTREGMKAIRGYLADELRLYGFTINQAKNIAATGDPDANRGREGGAVRNTRAVGGMANPFATGAADDHILMDPRGRPVAAMSGTEGILNTPQMGIVDTALAVSSMLGVQPYGGLNALWGSGMRHYATGGILSRANELERLKLPYVWGGHHGERGPITNPRPGLDCSSAVSFVLGIPPRVSGAFENFGSPGPGPVTLYANAQHILMRIAGRFFGTSRTNPGGGPGWLGEQSPSYLSRFTVRHVDGDVGADAGATGDVRRINVRGGGAAGRLVQRALDVARAGANRLIGGATTGADDPSGQPLRSGEAVMGRSALMALIGRALRRVNWYSRANAQALYGRVMQESGGDPNAVNNSDSNARAGDPSVGLAQVIGSTFQAHRDPELPNDQRHPLANLVAALNYMRARYRRVVGPSNTGYSLGGRLRRFATGGKLSRTGQALRELGDGGQASYRRLRNIQGPRVEAYDDALASAERNSENYSYLDRKFGLSDEELIDEDTGQVDTVAVRKRAEELRKLIDVRRVIAERLATARTVAQRVVKTYGTLMRRLRQARGRVKGKKSFVTARRAYYDNLISTYRERRTEWQGKSREAFTNLRDARLDIEELTGERADVLGTRAPAADAPDVADPGGDVDGGADTSEAVQAPPSPAEVAAQAIAQFASFQAARADLFGSYGANFRSAGAGPLDAVGQAAGTRFYGGSTGGTDGGVLAGAGAAITQNVYLMGPQPADPHTFTATSLHELKALI
jgi:SLT domain-containing protein